MEKMIFTAEENSFIIEAEGKKLRVSYEEFYGNHKGAMKFCKEHGGGDETIENIHIISKYRDEINKELKALGKTIIEGWYWTNKLSWKYDNFAFVVSTSTGRVSYGNRDTTKYALAVSAL